MSICPSASAFLCLSTPLAANPPGAKVCQYSTCLHVQSANRSRRSTTRRMHGVPNRHRTSVSLNLRELLGTSVAELSHGPASRRTQIVKYPGSIPTPRARSARECGSHQRPPAEMQITGPTLRITKACSSCLRPTDPPVRPAGIAPHLRAETVPSVDNDASAHGLTELIGIYCDELLPLGQDHHHVSARARLMNA